jgi:hypothetical protein
VASDTPSDNHTIAPAASAEEAAAIVAALERFARDTHRADTHPAAAALDPWRRAALLEGVSRWMARQRPEPWINL